MKLIVCLAVGVFVIVAVGSFLQTKYPQPKTKMIITYFNGDTENVMIDYNPFLPPRIINYGDMVVGYYDKDNPMTSIFRSRVRSFVIVSDSIK